MTDGMFTGGPAGIMPVLVPLISAFSALIPCRLGYNSVEKVLVVNKVRMPYNYLRLFSKV